MFKEEEEEEKEKEKGEEEEEEEAEEEEKEKEEVFKIVCVRVSLKSSVWQYFAVRPHAGVCPTVESEPLFFGICASGCENDNGCLETQKCCPTACGGTSCMDVIVSGNKTFLKIRFC